MPLLRAYSLLPSLALLFIPFSVAEPIRINGFFSTGITDADADNGVLENNAIEKKTNYLADTVLGLQLEYLLSPETRFSGQLVAKDGSDSFDVKAEWLYVAHNVDQATQVRAGRLRLPVYGSSETILVGQSYDWVRPPLEVYSLTAGLTRYNGLNVLHHFTFDNSTLYTQIYLGQAKDSLNFSSVTADINTDSLRGLQIIYESELITFWASRLEADVDFSVAAFNLTLDTTADISVVGTDIEIDNWGIQSEYGVLDAERLGDTSAYYISLYYGFDKFTPIFTYAKSNTDTNIVSSDIEGDSITLGFRYDASDNLSLKAQVFKGELIDGLSALLIPPTPNFDGEVTVISVSLNLIF